MRNEGIRDHIWLWVGGMMALAILIAGCGGGEETAATPTLATAADTAADASSAAEESEEAAPTETAVPPTDAPAPTKTAEPTAPPTATGAPDPTPTATAEANVAGQTACDHPYLPLRQGATWTYSDGSQEYVWTVQSVEGDAESASAVLQIDIGDVTINYDWQCNAGEGLTSFDFANLSLTQTEFDMNLDLEGGNGQVLPPAEELELGYTWQVSYTNNISFTQEAGGTTIVVTGDMTVDETNEIIGVDPVTLDDGTAVEAIQVAQSDTIVLNLSVMDQTTTQTTSLSGTHTYARDIGMVRQAAESEFGSNEMVLVSYDIP